MGSTMTDPFVEREEKRQVRIGNMFGEAIFLNGVLWDLQLGLGTAPLYPSARKNIPLPSEEKDTEARLQGYIDFLVFVRQECLKQRQLGKRDGSS